MTPLEYEIVVRHIAESLFVLAEKMQAEEVKYGLKNKWTGISGFQHQIDVSIAGKQDIILIECKYWSDKVDVPGFLTFLARVLDIKERETRRSIYPIFVTTIGFDSGVQILADYYGIKLNIIRSVNEFAMQYKNFATLGISDEITIKDSLTIEKKDKDGNLVEVRKIP